MGGLTPQTPGSRTSEQTRAYKRGYREGIALIAAVVVAIAIAVALGGIAALHIIRFIIAILVVVLAIASRAVRNRQHSKEQTLEAHSQERDDVLWQREQERYAAKQRSND